MKDKTRIFYKKENLNSLYLELIFGGLAAYRDCKIQDN